MISSRFRRQVKNILLKKCWRSIKCHNEQRQINTPRNQICPEIGPPSISTYQLE